VFRTIRWKLITSSLLAVGIPLIGLAYLFASLLWQFHLQQLGQELRTKAFVMADAVSPVLSPSTPDDPGSLTRMVEGWRRYSNMRVTVADSGGIVRAATSGEGVGAPIDPLRRPGMKEALDGSINATVWKSPNFAYEETMYVNVPVREDGVTIGVVRVAYSLAQIQGSVTRIQRSLVSSFGLYVLIIIGLTLWLADTIVRPVEKLTRSARRLAAGDLGHRTSVRGTQEVRLLGGALNHMSERLQYLEGMRRQYVSDVSHELRTPLASIRGMAETIMTHGESDPAMRGRYLPRIITQTERLARLASQILDLANVESGTLVGALEPVTLAAVVEETIQTCTDGAANKGVELVLDATPSLPDVAADRDRLVQVFLNLADNALRYTPSGGRVTFTLRSDEGQLTTVVTDTGSGIPAEDLPHVFERFYRVDKSRSTQAGGTGLGLSIVREIVQAHGGSIAVESTIGQGTRFTLAFPALAAARVARINREEHSEWPRPS
jgi:signal transduction histidine kinase